MAECWHTTKKDPFFILKSKKEDFKKKGLESQNVGTAKIMQIFYNVSAVSEITIYEIKTYQKIKICI